jgi:hypothetical protein
VPLYPFLLIKDVCRPLSSSKPESSRLKILGTHFAGLWGRPPGSATDALVGFPGVTGVVRLRRFHPREIAARSSVISDGRGADIVRKSRTTQLSPNISLPNPGWDIGSKIRGVDINRKSLSVQ